MPMIHGLEARATVNRRLVAVVREKALRARPMGSKGTKTITIDPARFEESQLLPAAEAVKEGRLVVFPTETVYGVGCRHDKECARDEIYRLKHRERSKPLGMYLLSAADLRNHAVMTGAAEKLAQAFLPGPLTIVLAGRDGDKIGFRVPSDRVSRALIALSGIPLAGTSANLSGQASPVTGEEALAAMEGKVDVIINGGKTEWGRESTVIDLSGERPMVLREGCISLNELSEVLGENVEKGF